MLVGMFQQGVIKWVCGTTMKRSRKGTAYFSGCDRCEEGTGKSYVCTKRAVNEVRGVGEATHIIFPGEIEMHQSEGAEGTRRRQSGEDPGSAPQAKSVRHDHPARSFDLVVR